MEEKMIEVIVKESDSNKNNFPNKDSQEGEKMIQAIRKETAIDDIKK